MFSSCEEHLISAIAEIKSVSYIKKNKLKFHRKKVQKLAQITKIPMSGAKLDQVVQLHMQTACIM